MWEVRCNKGFLWVFHTFYVQHKLRLMCDYKCKWGHIDELILETSYHGNSVGIHLTHDDETKLSLNQTYSQTYRHRRGFSLILLNGTTLRWSDQVPSSLLLLWFKTLHWFIVSLRSSWSSIHPPELKSRAKPDWGWSDCWLHLHPQLSWWEFSQLVQHSIPPAVPGQTPESSGGEEVRPQTYGDILLWVHQWEPGAPEHLLSPVCQR